MAGMRSSDWRSVAGVYTPAFVERSLTTKRPDKFRRVSPEFILRPSLSVGSPIHQSGYLTGVSPEFILRPSLSVRRVGRERRKAHARVAGVYTPAFVERS